LSAGHRLFATGAPRICFFGHSADPHRSAPAEMERKTMSQRDLPARAAVLGLAIVLAGASFVLAQSRAPAPRQRTPERPPAWARTAWAYPTGDEATSAILLERLTPPNVRVGTSFEYRLRLTNLTARDIADVVLVEQFPPHFRVERTGPPVALDRLNRRGSWRWARLAPRDTKIVRIQGTTDRAAPLDMCATVTFTDMFCASVPVVDPRLSLTKTAPREVLVCDPIPLQFVVTNSGTGTVRDVRITDTLPNGLATPDGANVIVLDAGDLAAGQSRAFDATVRASTTGEYSNTAEARDTSGLTASASATTIVRQPVLVVEKQGPQMRYIGRSATFKITVANTGDAPARDVVLTDALPRGLEPVTVDGGQYAEDRVIWNLGTLPPGRARTVSLTVKGNQAGTFRNTATAEAYCARAAATAVVEYRGIPAMLLEVVDAPDPIEIGSTVTYTIEVTNQGSAVGTNIVIEGTLPEQLQFVSTAGPVPGTVTGQTVRFAPLASLAPKAKVTYQVVARGLQEVDARFKVTMTGDQMTSPVEETESTHVY
jgi:uncharacterized repeat protein (TIGR01451 family)